MAEAPSSLPESLHRYFWDYEPTSLSVDDDRHTVVLRLIQVGGLDGMTWLLREIGPEDLRDFIIRRQGRGISPPRLRFWGLILDIPRSQVDEWVAIAQDNPWLRR